MQRRHKANTSSDKLIQKLESHPGIRVEQGVLHNVRTGKQWVHRHHISLTKPPGFKSRTYDKRGSP